MKKTAVLITTFNRKETTLRGLDALRKAILHMDKEVYHFDFFLVDDGSTDGTYESVSTQFPEVHLYKGDGNLYWVHGTQMAWKKAVETDDYDYFLWFNDDNCLYENALEVMFQSAKDNPDSIICGALCNHNGQPSFCGRDRKGNMCNPNGTYVDIHRMHGNLVLIPHKVFHAVGMMDTRFRHFFGDFDYGFTVREAGFSILLTPSFVGTNDNHDDELMNHLKELSLRERWKMTHNIKHHPKYTFLFHKKHMGLHVAIKEYITHYLYILFPSFLN